ncbi:MAG: hypothetical protein KatS3mg031_2070 [Chitinophagales bacterium]|nr:MAG: hypothetical protein KatS3mg031_2070 [Chitinophagales bacterium]
MYHPVDSEHIFQHATEGIIVVDAGGNIVRANPSAERMFGYDAGELIGKQVENLIPARFAERHKSHRKTYVQVPRSRSMGANIELYGLKKKGDEFPVEVSLSPYTTPEGLFVIAFIVDITQRKSAEEKLKNYSQELENQVRRRTLILEEAIDELEKTKNELNKALEKERELNELKSRFVSMASHEFRTPLATILSSVSLIEAHGRRGNFERQQHHISKIKSAITNLTDILNDFLSLSRLEEGKVECRKEKLDIRQFVASVVNEIEPLAKEGQKITYQHRGPASAYLDKKILKNILFNLISNAIKFSEAGKSIEVLSDATDSEITLSVRDHGIGISKEDQKHLFERFFRGRNAMNIQGTGLGLNIVMKYVELMGGRIAFESEENKGTVFTIIFKNQPHDN